MHKQIDLMVHWMRVGFVHGVMNTDNMLISGESIDYGPCAFMDVYHPHTVFSSIDHMGRYSYGNQPQMAQWNVARFAESILPLIDKDLNRSVNIVNDVLTSFSDIYQSKWLEMMCCKLGIADYSQKDESMVNELLDYMKINKLDYTHTFYDLTYNKKLTGKVYEKPDFLMWYKKWQDRIHHTPSSSEQAKELMQKNNPVFIPRNHIVEEVLAQAQDGDLKPFNDFVTVLTSPYEDNNTYSCYKQTPPSDGIYRTYCGT